MKILFVANYLPDRQESMTRVAALTAEALRNAGVDIEIIRPEPFFGGPRRRGLVGKWLGYLDKYLVFPFQLRARLSGFDLVHIGDHSNAVYVFALGKKPHLVNCHDLLAVRAARGEFPAEQIGFTGRILQHWILRGLRRARTIVCISDATLRDAFRLTGKSAEHVERVYLGQNYTFAPDPAIQHAAEARRRGQNFETLVWSQTGLPHERYVLHVGGDVWYKNRAGVLKIYAALRRRLGEKNAPRLLMVGPPLASPQPGVEVRTGIDAEALARLYAGAELLLFPSLAEGFGWPIIEAQACGCRVLTTDRAPMNEIGGAGAFYLADPDDLEASAARLEALLTQDPAARNTMVQAGFANATRFSAREMAEKYLALYQRQLSSAS